MSLLVPVLNTNFWLATHVTCITIGYALAIVTSLMGHIYILAKCFKGRNLEILHKNMTFGVFLALFFCLFGTVLGGIWADQSLGALLGMGSQGKWRLSHCYMAFSSCSRSFGRIT